MLDYHYQMCVTDSDRSSYYCVINLGFSAKCWDPISDLAVKPPITSGLSHQSAVIQGYHLQG